MTNQEAITLLKNIKLFTGYEAKPQITSKLLISLHISIDMAVDALEKQEPKSSVEGFNEDEGTKWNECGDCAAVIRRYCTYCSSCGKAIKWEI